MDRVLEGWQHPAWLLLAAAVPLLYWWRSRAQRPQVVATGSLELWRRVAEQERATGGALRRRPPAWVLWLLAAWFLASLGLAEWRGAGRVVEPRRWMVVDLRAAAWGPDAANTAPGVDGWPARTRIEGALEAIVDNTAPGPQWHVFDGRRVRALSPAALPELFAHWRATGPTRRAPDWSAWDRDDALWVLPSANSGPRPERAGLWVIGGSEVPGAIAREGERLAWFEDGAVEWRPAPVRSRELCVPADLPALLVEFCAAYAEAHDLVLGRSPCGSEAALDLRHHALPGAGTWEREVAGLRLQVTSPEHGADVSSKAGDASGAAAWLAERSSDLAVAPLLRLGPGWVSFAAGDWRVARGDPAVLALELGRMLDAHWRPEPGVLPIEARRDLGAPAYFKPRGAAWTGADGRKRAPGRFMALAFALAAGAAWVAASRST